jgi:hypothetical protein
LLGTLSTSSPKSENVGLQAGLTPPVVAQMISASAIVGLAGSKLLRSTPASSWSAEKVFSGITVNLPIFYPLSILLKIHN